MFSLRFLQPWKVCRMIFIGITLFNITRTLYKKVLSQSTFMLLIQKTNAWGNIAGKVCLENVLSFLTYNNDIGIFITSI